MQKCAKNQSYFFTIDFMTVFNHIEILSTREKKSFRYFSGVVYNTGATVDGNSSLAIK